MSHLILLFHAQCHNQRIDDRKRCHQRIYNGCHITVCNQIAGGIQIHRRMHTVCDRDHFRTSIVGKFKCLQCTHGISRKADSDDHIVLVNAHHLFKQLTGAVGGEQMHIVKHQIQIKPKEAGQRCTASNSYYINISCIENGCNRIFKCIMVDFFQCRLNFIRIGLQYCLENFRLTDPTVSNLHALNGIQLVAHQFLQRLLKFRIPFISKKSCKPDNCGFTDSHCLSHLCRSEKHSLIIIIRNIGGKELLSLAHRTVTVIDPIQQLICICHHKPLQILHDSMHFSNIS